MIWCNLINVKVESPRLERYTPRYAALDGYKEGHSMMILYKSTPICWIIE